MRRRIAAGSLLLVAAAGWFSFERSRATRVHAGAGSAIFLGPAQPVSTRFAGPDGLTQALSSGGATPLSLASADLDGDGISDLVGGYSVNGAGALAIYRGNLDAFAPQSQDSFDAIARSRFPAPLLPDAVVVAAPVRPDLLGTGRFSGSPYTGIVLAAQQSHTIYLMSRDDSGQWQTAQSVDVPGAITALTAVRMDTRQPYYQVLIGYRDDRGPKLAVYSGSDAGLQPTLTQDLPGDATALDSGDLDGDGVPDAAIAAGGSLLVLHGADLQSAVDSPSNPALLERIPLPFGVTQTALGNFIFDRTPRLQIAAVSTDGSIHILAHQSFDSRGLTPADISQRRQASRMRRAPVALADRPPVRREPWKDIENYTGMVSAGTSGTPAVFRTRISNNSADDVMVLDPIAGTLSLIVHGNQQPDGTQPDGAVLSRPEELRGLISGTPVRVNVDARPGVVLLRAGSPSPLVMMPLPDPTFTVNRTDDITPRGTGATCNTPASTDCTLREAIIKANATAGADIIMLPAGTYTLTIGGANENAAATGDLDITDGVSIVGGPGTTIVQAGASAGTGIDKVFSINPLFGASFDVSMSGFTIQFGKNPSPIIGDGMGGGMDFDSGTGGTGNLVLTNMVVANNSTTDGDGGGMALFNSGGGGTGVITITNSTVSSNTAQESSTGGSGVGGGIFVGAGAHIALTNTTVSSNLAIQNNTPKGSGGGIAIFGPTGAGPQSAIHGGLIQSNQASGEGGGIWATAGITIDTNAKLAFNTAGTDGGGLWYNALGETATISKTQFLANTATGKGGGIEVSNGGAATVLHVSFSRFASNGAATGSNLNNDGSTVNATFSGPTWWGTNTPAPTIAGTVTFDPFIVLSHTASPGTIRINNSSTLTGSFLQDNHGTAISAGNLDVLIGGTITFGNAVLGTIPQAQPETIAGTGTATATFNAGGTPGNGHADATVDSATVTANITILAPPSITKSFGASPVAINAPSTITFSINNPNTVPIDSNFTDTLPASLVVAATPSVTNTCGGSVTATAGTGSIAWSNASLAVGTCSITVNVSSAADNNYSNSVTINSTIAGTGNTSSANLTVINPPVITKAFGAANLPLNGTTSLTFLVGTTNSNLTLTGVAFTDNLPAGLVVATPNGLSNTCGGTATAVAGSGTVSLSGGSVAPGPACQVQVNVLGSTPGVKNNSVQVSSTNGGTGNTSNASITVLSPPTLIKAFGAASIPLNGATSLSFTVNNPNTGSTLNAIGFSDTLPAGLVVSTPNGLTGSCGGGAITATQATSVISLSGATLAASASCTFSVNVTGTAAGAQNNTTGNITSTEGGTGGTASASISVVAPPSIAKAFNPSTIALNATTSLTFTITNPAANTVALTGVAFTDTLPTGLTVANATSTVCGGTLTTTAPTGVALSGATIAVNSQCQFSVTVTGAASGQYTNTTGSVSSTNGGTGNTASANLTVAAPPSITKQFGAANIPLNGTTSLTFTIQNPNTTVALSGIAFTDNLPAGLSASSAVNTCGGAAATPAGQVTLSGGSLASSASCTVTVTITGTTAGVKNNSVQVTSTEGGTGNTSNASVTVVGPPVIIKAFGAASIPLNGSTSLTFTIQNNNTTTTVTGIGFSDTLPAGLVVSTPNGLTGSCGGGTITATAGTNTVSLSGASLAASTSCTFAINITGAAGGTQNNTTGNVTSTEGGTGGTASASINVVAPPSIAKAFNPAGIPANSTASLTFTITNPSSNAVALTGVAFTDTLPTGLTVANASATVCGGTVTTTAPTGIALSGATIAANSQCQFSVTVTGAASGNYTNTTGNVTSTNGGTGNTATSNLTVAAPPTITKQFGAATVPLNGTTGLTFTINNPNSNVTLNGVAFTDNLPAGLSASGASTTCGGAAATPAGQVTLSGGSLASSSSCTVTVTITGTTAGVKNNSVQVTSTEGGTGNTSNASITVVAPPVVIKAFGAASIPLGGSTSLQFTISNPNTTVALSGIALTDTLPAGLVVSTPNGVNNNCSVAPTAVAGSGSIGLSGAAVAASSSCTFFVNVTGVAAGTENNTTGSVTSTEGGTGGTASASIAVVAPPSITKAFTPANIPLNATSALQFAITNPAANTVPLTGVGFADTLPANLTVTNNSISQCGGTLTTSGGNTITLTGAAIPVGGQCLLTVAVTGTASGNYVNTTGNVTSTNGGAGNTATANLAVTVAATVVTASPAGLKVTVDNVTVTAPQTFQWIVGSTHTIAAPSPQAGAPGTQYVFRTWSDAGAISHTVTAPSSPISYTATFGTQYFLTTTASPSNGGTVTPASGYFDANSTVPLQAIPASGFQFAAWTGPVANPASSSTTVALTGPLSVTADFKQPAKDQTITFTPIPDHILGDPPFPISATASSGLPVTFSILSGPATVSGNVITLTGVGTVLVQASQAGNDSFNAATATWQFRVLAAGVTLSLSASPTGGGTVTATPPGPVYAAGSSVVVTAQANPGYIFIGFSGALSGLTNPQTLQLTQSSSVTANFALISTDPNDQFVFGFTGGNSPPSQSAPLSGDTTFAALKAGVRTSPAAAGPAALVIPATGGNWLNATVDAGPPPSLQLSLNSAVVSQLPTGTYISYVLATSASGQQRVLTVKLLVDVVLLTKVLDGAGFRSQPLASEELVTVFGLNEASSSLSAPSLPLGASLSGTSVIVTDGAGVSRAALLLYVSNTQVNLVTPAGMAPGSGSLTVANAAGQKGTIAVQIAATAPGLFTAAQSGQGVAAAVVIRVNAAGVVTNSLAATCDATGACTPVAIALNNTDQVFVSFYGTGIRGVSGLAGTSVTIGGVPVEVQFAGAQPQYPGLDQVNVKLPPSLAGKGDVTVNLTLDGNAANPVSIRIQ